MRWFYALLILSLLLVGAFSEEDEFDDEPEVPTITESEPAQEAVNYQSPYAEPGQFYFAEHFDELNNFEKKWVKSQAKKEDAAEEIAKYDGVWAVEAPNKQLLRGDLGLVLKSKAKHAAISSRLIKPFVFTDKPFIVQYEVTLQDGQECGGAYIKLLSSGKETTDLKNFHDKTPYTIMFGPDKCGNDIKLHFIFRHVNPINGTITEKHAKKPKERLEEPFKDKSPHLYQLIIKPDNTFTVSVDHKVVNEGSLLADFTPPVNPPREIDDPNDKKPSDWDEREKIPDPDAKKPEDWDEDAPPQIPDSSASKPEGWLDDEEDMIPDPNAEKPNDWDTEMDGEWEAPLIQNPLCENAVGCGSWKSPLIQNPNYKGKWRAPFLENPNYQGKWAPKKIRNPDFFEDLNPFKMTPISAVGIELWSMSSDILFDNFVITDDVIYANQWADQTYDLKRKQIDKDANTIYDKIMKHLNYKPGWWAVYFCYCLVPIIGYVWYLLSRRTKNKVFLFDQNLVKLLDPIKIPYESTVPVVLLSTFTNENPWMWAVYVVVVGLPLALIVFFMSNKEKIGTKKTDDYTPDDNELINEDENNDSEEVLKSEGVKMKKSDLDEPVNYKKTDDKHVGEDSADDDGDEDTPEELEKNVEDDEEIENVEDNQTEIKETETNSKNESTEGARKRKPRRE